MANFLGLISKNKNRVLSVDDCSILLFLEFKFSSCYCFSNIVGLTKTKDNFPSWANLTLLWDCFNIEENDWRRTRTFIPLY